MNKAVGKFSLKSENQAYKYLLCRFAKDLVMFSRTFRNFKNIILEENIFWACYCNWLQR
jgi:hypothetical protein